MVYIFPLQVKDVVDAGPGMIIELAQSTCEVNLQAPIDKELCPAHLRLQDGRYPQLIVAVWTVEQMQQHGRDVVGKFPGMFPPQTADALHKDIADLQLTGKKLLRLLAEREQATVARARKAQGADAPPLPKLGCAPPSWTGAWTSGINWFRTERREAECWRGCRVVLFCMNFERMGGYRHFPSVVKREALEGKAAKLKATMSATQLLWHIDEEERGKRAAAAAAAAAATATAKAAAAAASTPMASAAAVISMSVEAEQARKDKETTEHARGIALMVQQHRDAKTKQDKEKHTLRSTAKKVVNTDAVSVGKGGTGGRGGGGHQVPYDPLSLTNLDKIVTGYDKSVTGDDVVTATLFIDAVIAGDVGAVRSQLCYELHVPWCAYLFKCLFYAYFYTLVYNIGKP
jgi:hypothetical protein